MNVIDALVVTLGIDPSGFKKGQKDAHEDLKKTKDQAEKTNKGIEEGAKKATFAYAKLRNEVLGLITAFLGVSALKSFVENVTTGDAAIGRLANNLGMSTVDLSAWEGAVKRAGGSSEGMASTMQSLNTQMQRLWTFGVNDLNPLLIMSGVNTSRFNDRATTMTERLMMLSEALSKMPRAKAQLFGAQLGLDQGTINLLEQGRTSVERLLAAQRGLNVVSERDAQLAIQRQIAWQNLIDRFVRLGRVIVNQLSPPLIDLLNRFVSWMSQTENIDKLTKMLKDFVTTLAQADWKGIGEGVKEIGEAFVLLAKGIAMSVRGYKELYGLIKEKTEGAQGLALGGSYVAPGTSPTAGLLWYPSEPGPSTSSTKSSVSIGSVIIQTQATDAKGIAADMGAALNKQFSFAVQSNPGLN